MGQGGSQRFEPAAFTKFLRRALHSRQSEGRKASCRAHARDPESRELGQVRHAGSRSDVDRRIERLHQRPERSAVSEPDRENTVRAGREVGVRAADRLIEALGVDKGIQLILNKDTPGLVWADKSLDITTDVIERFNKVAAQGGAPAVARPVPVKR